MKAKHSGAAWHTLAAAGLALAAVLAACAPAAPTPAPTSAPAKPAEAKAAPKPAEAKPAAKPAEGPDWRAEWDKVVAAAKQEGKVVVVHNRGDTYRTALSEFQKAYPEIVPELHGMAGRDAATRILAERRADQYLWDVYTGGTTTALFILVPEKAAAPLRPAIILPEVLNDQVWFGGFDDGWVDEQKQSVYAFQGEVDGEAHVNRDFVSEQELRSVDELEDPKWRGKIVWDDPRGTGNGNGPAAHILFRKGEDFLKKVLQNDITISNDGRQLMDWLVRGRYPVAVGVERSVLADYKKEGLGTNIKELNLAQGQRISAGAGGLILIDRAPHPNAAKVFINWLLSREGQTAWATHNVRNSRRTDVPPGLVELALRAGQNYTSLDKEGLSKFKPDAQRVAKEVLG